MKKAKERIFCLGMILLIVVFAIAEPIVPHGYYVEEYVTGLTNVSGIAFSPGGGFGYENQLFVLDSRPNGKIYRVPSKNNKIVFASGPTNELISLDFAPIGSPFGPNLFFCVGYDIYYINSSGAASHFADIHAFPWNLKFAPGVRFRNNLFHADGWEPSREAVREWKIDGTQSVLVYTDREETVGLAFGSGGEFGNDLYILFQKQGRNGYKPATISRVTPEGVMTDWFVFPSEYENTIAFAFDSTDNFGGNLFISEFTTNKILEIDAEGNLSEFASGFSFSSHPDHWHLASRIAFGQDGSMYISDGGAGIVWRIIKLYDKPNTIYIQGPNEVAEKTDTPYKAIAVYDNNSTKDVTDEVYWLLERDKWATVDQSGVLSTEMLVYPQENVTLIVELEDGNDIYVAEKDMTIYAMCPEGSALEFDGVDDFVNCGNDNSLKPPLPVTIMAWIKLSNLNKFQQIVNIDEAHSSYYGIWFQVTDENKLAINFGDGGRSSGVSRRSKIGETNVQTDKWYHVAGVIRDSLDMSLYINGNDDNGYYNGTGGALTYSNGMTTIGSITGVKSFFEGLADEVCIFDKALSVGEIKQNMCYGLTGNEPNLVGYWNFDEGEGQTAYDSGGNGNDGYLGNDPCNPDVADPCWVEPGASYKCTPPQMVRRNLRGTIHRKKAAKRLIGEALERERATQRLLASMCRRGNKGPWNRRTIIRAYIEIFHSMKKEYRCLRILDESIKDIKKAIKWLTNGQHKPNDDIRRED